MWVSMGEPSEQWDKRVLLLLPNQVTEQVMQAPGKSDTKFPNRSDRRDGHARRCQRTAMASHRQDIGPVGAPVSSRRPTFRAPRPAAGWWLVGRGRRDLRVLC
jgi:hypothetical protein